MWISDRWNSDAYTVLDASDGEKLERWGKYTLIRPDPQVIWSTGRGNPAWTHPDAHYHRSERGGGNWEFFNLPETWDIKYAINISGDEAPAGRFSGNMSRKTSEGERRLRGAAGGQCPADHCAGDAAGPVPVMTLRLKPFKFKHTGVFPEQAVNWDLSYRLIRKRIAAQSDAAAIAPEAGGHPVKVLNLFAYTGGATIAAALAGAHVTHVDASKGMVGWARENAGASGLSSAPIRWLTDDCTKFAEREIRRGNKYDAVIMDPPSYGRGPRGEVWKIEDDIFGLIRLTMKLFSDEPLFMFVNSYTTGLQAGVLKTMLELAAGPGGAVSDAAAYSASELGLPIYGTDLILPQGATGRYIP